jgi:hypothetical protein
MILRITSTGGYYVYDLANNKIVTFPKATDPGGGVLFDPTEAALTQSFAGSNMPSGFMDAANSTAVVTAVKFNLGSGNLQDFYLRTNTKDGIFSIYEFNAQANTFSSGNNLGGVGPSWKTVGFTYFANGTGQADFLLSNTTGQNTDYQIYNIVNQKLQSTNDVGLIGSAFTPLGAGPDATDFNFDLMFVRTGQLTTSLPSSVLGASNVVGDARFNPILAYAITQGKVSSVSYMGSTGLDYIGLGNFNANSPIGGMMMRNPNSGDIWIYDITKDNSGRYILTNGSIAVLAAQSGMSPTTPGKFNLFNQIPVGLVPLNGTLTETDLVTQDTKTGDLRFYDIQNDMNVNSGTLMPGSQVGGVGSFTAAFGTDFSGPTPSAGSQLAQAMASFGGSSGAAAGVTTAPLGADTSQQQQSFLTTSQHA